MDDLDDGRELEHLGVVDVSGGRRGSTGPLLAVGLLVVGVVVGLAGERFSRPAQPTCERSALSVRSWGVVGVDERSPVVFAVVDVPPAAHIVRLAVDGEQDTAAVIDGHAVVAVPLSTARLRDAVAGRLSDAALADVGSVRVVARDADGWSVARAAIGTGC